MKHDIRVMPLTCNYRTRNDGGRLYAIGRTVACIKNDGEARTVALQAAPKEVRAFACCRFARDYDMFSAHHVILLQLATKLTWSDKREPPQLAELASWCADRPAYIDHIAETHSLQTDAERWPDYRKDMAKILVLRLLYGGAYDGWIRKNLKRPVEYEPRSARVDKLAKELENLRNAVFDSIEWCDFVRKDRERLRREGIKRTADEIDRSVFSRIAQKLENQILTSMRRFVSKCGFKARTLCFDGMIVENRRSRTLNLAEMRAAIMTDTGYDIRVDEKPLYSETFPVLSLKH
jgi:hypothetical protein